MRYALVLALLMLPAWPAASQTVEELKAQLAAQKQINELLKQRVETLEAELAGREIALLLGPKSRRPRSLPMTRRVTGHWSGPWCGAVPPFYRPTRSR
jgi:type II secretory pathway pseudopilin PulG